MIEPGCRRDEVLTPCSLELLLLVLRPASLLLMLIKLAFLLVIPRAYELFRLIMMGLPSGRQSAKRGLIPLY